MASYNRVVLVGNVTRDIELKYTPGGTAVTEIGLAVNRTWFDKQSQTKKEDVTFIDVTIWGKSAEVAGQYLAKGRPVLIEGRLSLDTWDDKTSGQKRSKLKVICEHMQLLGSKGDSRVSQAGTDGDSTGYYDKPVERTADELFPPTTVPDDEVPF